MKSAPIVAVVIVALLSACANSGSPKAAAAAPPTAAVPAAAAAPASAAEPPSGAVLPESEIAAADQKLEKQRAESRKLRAANQQRARQQYANDRIAAWRLAHKLADLRSMENNRVVDVISVVACEAGYRIVLAVTGATTQMWTEIVSHDGDRVFVEPVDLDLEGRRTVRHHEYAQCLAKAGFKVYAQPRHKASSRQLAILGEKATTVAVACPKGAADPACKTAKVSVLPSVVHKGTVYPGVRDRGWIAALTGCL